MKHHQLYFHQHFKFHRIIDYFQVGRDLGIWCNALIFTSKLSSSAQTHTDKHGFDTRVEDPVASFLLFFFFFILNFNH